MNTDHLTFPAFFFKVVGQAAQYTKSYWRTSLPFLQLLQTFTSFQSYIKYIFLQSFSQLHKHVASSARANLLMPASALECRMSGRSQTAFGEMCKTRQAGALGSTGRTVSLINIHHAQSGSKSWSPNMWCKCKAASPHPPPHSCVCRQGLMGTEHHVIVMPCIKKTCSRKVQNKWCLPSNNSTTCQSDLQLLKVRW